IAPGEVYQFRLPVKVPRVRTVALEQIKIQAADAVCDDLVDLPPRRLQILPAVAREIKLRVEPLCAYDSAIKAELAVKHGGAAPFTGLTITLEPEDRIRAGKRVLRWASFEPGREERIEFVVAGEKVDLTLAARAAGVDTEARLTLPVGRVPDRAERQRFRFLE